jgi:hypothetical protein
VFRTALIPVALAALAAAGCGTRDPCRKLADRDCARHGTDSAICRDAQRRAAYADPYLVEVCRAELQSRPAGR